MEEQKLVTLPAEVYNKVISTLCELPYKSVYRIIAEMSSAVKVVDETGTGDGE